MENIKKLSDTELEMTQTLSRKVMQEVDQEYVIKRVIKKEDVEKQKESIEALLLEFK